MKDIKKVTLIGLGAMGVFFAPRISEKLGADFRTAQEKSVWSEKG
jgi:2-dehydropantoate 2-reductase